MRLEEYCSESVSKSLQPKRLQGKGSAEVLRNFLNGNQGTSAEVSHEIHPLGPPFRLAPSGEGEMEEVEEEVSEHWMFIVRRKFWRIWHTFVRDNWLDGRNTDNEWCCKCCREHPDGSITT